MEGPITRPRSASSASVGSRSSSLRAFRSLGQGIRGFTRAQAGADAGRTSDVDVTTVVRRIAATLSSAETYQKVALNLFDKFAEAPRGGSPGGQKLLAVDKVPQILAHWGLPAEHAQIFWALLRKQEMCFDSPVLPEYIKWSDVQAVLIKVLRRVRDKYCPSKVMRSNFVMQNRRTFAQEYSMLDSCGKGSFGECFWVTHRISKMRRVCKKIQKEATAVPQEEVSSELDILKRLDHPNVLRVFEWFEDEDAYMIVVQAAAGGDLKQLLVSSREASRATKDALPGLEEALTCALMEQALQGLAYVHSMNVLHRDIKPGNLLLGSADLAKPRLLLADFGVAEICKEPWALNAAMRGTVAYMAPEVFLSEVGPRSDVWALGVVTYELLVGERPFLADNPMAMYAQLKTASVNLDKVRTSKASEEAASFIGRLLVKDPRSRPSASEALGDGWLSAAHRSGMLSGRQARLARQNLTNFSKMSHVGKAAMSCVAAQLDTSKIEGLCETFESMDVDRNGTLSAAEFAAGLAELGTDPDSISQLVAAIDMDGDGAIQYSEFLASLLQVQGKAVEDVLYHAFHIFDVNGDGAISLDELRVILSGSGPLAAVLPDGKTIEQALSDLDASNDGVVSFDEFKDYLMREGSGLPKEAPADQVGLDDDSLEAVLCGLALAVGRSEAELRLQATRLAEVHWISTVGDLKTLTEKDWPRLGLPLKLERVLRSRLGV